MPSVYTLGKNYTVSGLTGASELTVTRSSERVDVTTRKGDMPYKATDSGLIDEVFECTVYAADDTSFVIGQSYAITVNGDALVDAVCMSANREEQKDGVITFKLTFRRGEDAEACNQDEVGPGDYRTCA